MMLLKRVEMENFGPYFGTQGFDFEGTSDELVLIHGENMSGKTSLLNAIRWCLYGEAKDRFGEPMATRTLINQDAFSEGAKRVSVTLDVISLTDDEETQIKLKRQRRANRYVPDPTAEREFSEHLRTRRRWQHHAEGSIRRLGQLNAAAPDISLLSLRRRATQGV